MNEKRPTIEVSHTFTALKPQSMGLTTSKHGPHNLKAWASQPHNRNLKKTFSSEPLLFFLQDQKISWENYNCLIKVVDFLFPLFNSFIRQSFFPFYLTLHKTIGLHSEQTSRYFFKILFYMILSLFCFITGHYYTCFTVWNVFLILLVLWHDTSRHVL